MISETWWQLLITLLGALGGLEAIKYFIERKSRKRQLQTDGDANDFHLLREVVEFLQGQLKEKEMRFAEQTELLRSVQRQNVDYLHRICSLEVDLAEVRCNDKECPYRQPPNAKTPSPSQPKDEYFKCRKPSSQGQKETPATSSITETRGG